MALRIAGRRLLARRLSAAAAAAGPPEIDQRRLPTNYDPKTFDPSSPPSRPPPSDRVWRLVDDVAALTLADLADLTVVLRQKMGVKDAPVVGIFGGGAAGGPAAAAGEGAAEKKEEKTVFELRLESFDAASKIKVIKEVRGFTDLGLKEAKELVEKAPAVIKGGVSKEEAAAIIEKMKAVGAKVVME